MTWAVFIKTWTVPLLFILLTTLRGAALAPVLAAASRLPSALACGCGRVGSDERHDHVGASYDHC
jgi:hypothetical protein